jgi:hypothetical protein
VYVQHKIREAGALVWDYLERGGSIYISGSILLFPYVFLCALTQCVHAQSCGQDAESRTKGTSGRLSPPRKLERTRLGAVPRVARKARKVSRRNMELNVLLLGGERAPEHQQHRAGDSCDHSIF